ncbi:apoptosis regulatory protein Siva isoform X2 [Ornithorhynchus anatinus]|uniref:apoptosis regulatory protein Siva isoform X2 n=1 Tax=Ornithorhynchus anatinus TaxID=9258 RepID=UPI0010A897B5|nr:apoptosis regulatory protein Siva isoform X2 [Ornithorhynchus anatinus]
MPKRRYPFAPDAPLQRKVRPGPGGLGGAAFGQRCDPDVFEKTKQLLFQGAQACMDHMWDGSPAGNRAVLRLPEEPPKPGPGAGAATAGTGGLSGQMVIGQDGRLLRKGLQATGTDPSVGASKACSFCVRTLDRKEACGQCDRYMCQNCVKTCISCSTTTCPLCSAADNGDVGEKILCSGCAMFEA